MSETITIDLPGNVFTNISQSFQGGDGVEHLIQNISGPKIEFIERLIANVPTSTNDNRQVRVPTLGSLVAKNKVGQITYARPLSTAPGIIVISERS